MQMIKIDGSAIFFFLVSFQPTSEAISVEKCYKYEGE